MNSGEDRKIILQAARKSIEARLNGKMLHSDKLLPSGAKLPAGSGGAFVTLKIDGALRGCIGNVVSGLPIVETIIKLACSAAFSDPRFPPLEKDELERVHIEISRMSELFPITEDEVEVGVHGLLLQKGGFSGLLLPQVPVEQGWTKAQYLSGLCHKSGLPDGAWKDPDAVLQGFTAEVFGE